jgi:hypothetical protein
LFAYLVSHFLNHVLGNISMEALAAHPHPVWQFPGRDPVLHRGLVHAARHLGAYDVAIR